MPRLDFDPNRQKQPMNDWATYIPGRRTKNEFVVHKRRGDALAAFTYARTGVLYRWRDGKPDVKGDVVRAGEWIEVFRIEDYEAPRYCENCDKDMERTYGHAGGGRVYNEGNPRWIDVDTSPRMITVCNACARFKSRAGRLP